jgi:hypothetical protein
VGCEIPPVLEVRVGHTGLGRTVEVEEMGSERKLEVEGWADSESKSEGA